jgi:NAD(P)-dependent dehydrogenase (short-subunit alcohol dehydrogenase family)
MNLGLKDCKAFIAGASKGLGKACAKALADEGARIFICARNEEALRGAASECDAVGYSAADRRRRRHQPFDLKQTPKHCRLTGCFPTQRFSNAERPRII